MGLETLASTAIVPREASIRANASTGRAAMGNRARAEMRVRVRGAMVAEVGMVEAEVMEEAVGAGAAGVVGSRCCGAVVLSRAC